MARERAANKPETTPPIIMNCLANISRVTLTSFTQKPAALSWEIFPTCSKLARSTYRAHVWSFCSDNWVLQEIHQVLSFHIYTSVGCNRLAHQDLNKHYGRHEPTVKLWTKGPSSEGSWFTKAGMFRHFSVNEAPLAQTSSFRGLRVCSWGKTPRRFENFESFLSKEQSCLGWRGTAKVMRIASLSRSCPLQSQTGSTPCKWQTVTLYWRMVEIRKLLGSVAEITLTP